MPRVVAPSLKVTVPVGVPGARGDGVTVAVKVTAWPKTDGLAEEVSVVVVLAWLTVWVSAAEVLVVEVGVAAVDGGDRVGARRASVEVVKVASPLASSVPVPRVVVPSLKVTVPVGRAGARG